MEDAWSPQLIATKNASANVSNPGNEDNKHKSNLRHVLLSPDGTTIITSSVHEQQRSSTVESLIIPPELLNGSKHELLPYSTLDLPEPARAVAAYSFFDLSDPSTTLALLSLADHPIRLINALALESGIVASYPNIRPETEEFIAAQSLVFTSDATRFLAGADSEVALFDLNRPGHHAMQRYKLRLQNQFNQHRQWPMKRGVVSSMTISADEILAVGTFGREVGLFEQNGQGDIITNFELDHSVRGAGVSQISWSQCGRYLLVSERKSDAIQVFDIRGQHRLLSTLNGRNASTMMHLRWDVGPDGSIWGGGTDGMVRCWTQVGLSEGTVNASLEWQAHEDPVVSTAIHQSGSVAVTASTPDRNKLRDMNLNVETKDAGLSHIQRATQAHVLALWALPFPQESADDLPMPALQINE